MSFTSQIMSGIKFLLFIFVFAIQMGCSPSQPLQLGSADMPTELGNQIGDVMASIDDAGKGSTTLAQFKPNFDQINKSSHRQFAVAKVFTFLIPKAVAETCGLSTYQACTANTVTRNFNGCMIGDYSLTGTVTMAWIGGSACALTAANQSIRVTPNYLVAGNNMSLSTTKTGTYGVTLTLAVSAVTPVWNYTNDGVNRTLSSNGTELLSITTRTNSPITITGSVRGNRTLSSGAGALEIINNTSGESCTFQASGVTWGATNCNCATAGTWIGSCSTLGTISMTLNGCGLATLNYSEDGTPKTKAIALDRCAQN